MNPADRTDESRRRRKPPREPTKAQLRADQVDAGAIAVTEPIVTFGPPPSCTTVATPAGIRLARDLARRGATMGAIAAAFNVGRRTFYEMRERQQELRDAVAEGCAGHELRLVDRLTEIATSPDTDPKVAAYACTVLLNSRHGWAPGRTPDGEGHATANVVIVQLPAAATSASDEQAAVERYLASLPAALPAPDPEGDPTP